MPCRTAVKDASTIAKNPAVPFLVACTSLMCACQMCETYCFVMAGAAAEEAFQGRGVCVAALHQKQTQEGTGASILFL